MNTRNFFAELKRRNVYKVAVAYAVVGWLVMQVAATVVPALHLPDGITSAVVVLTLLGFPIALVLAWAFEMTPEGLKRTENVSPDEVVPQWSRRKFAALIVSLALAAAGLLAFQFLRSKSGTSPSTASSMPAPAVTPAPAIPEKSVAVLAFTNLSDDKENEYFSDGISEELGNVLGRVPGLRVSGRNSAFYFKGKNATAQEIGQKLGVAYLVTGSVRKLSEQVRITAQLINAADGFQVWSSEPLTRECKDIFAVQDEIAGLIAQNLKLKLGDTGRVRKTVNPEAHRLLLEGRHFWNLRTQEGFARAEAAYTKALEIDPQFAEAHAGRADNYQIRAQYRLLDGLGGEEEDQKRALAEVQVAIRLDPALPEAYAAYAYLLHNQGKLAEADQYYQKVFALNPNYAVAHLWHGQVLDELGRLDEAVEENRLAYELDPLGFIIVDRYAQHLELVHRFEEALTFNERAAALRADTWMPNQGERAMILLALGRTKEAIEVARSIQRSSSNWPRWTADADAVWVLHRGGVPQEAESYAAQLLQTLPEKSYARADSHLWAKSYDRDINDVFVVESEVAQEIADALQAKLSPNESSTIASAPTKDPEAYDFFLKGEYEERQAEASRKPQTYEQAATWYRQAIARDPHFALAIARLAENEVWRYWYFEPLNDADLQKVKSTAEQAVTLAPDLAQGHIALGLYYYLARRQFSEGLGEFQRAQELQPNNVQALNYAAHVHRRQGQWQRHLSELARCEQLDPRDAQIPTQMGASYCRLRMWSEANRAGLRSLALDPHSLSGMIDVLLSHINGSGDIEKAKQTLAIFPADSVIASSYKYGGEVSNIIGQAPYVYVVMRDYAAALKAWDKNSGDPIAERDALSARAAIHVIAGDAAAAHDEIERAHSLVETRLREQPDDRQALVQLSWIDVALRRNSEAVMLARQAAEAMPPEKDAVEGPEFLAGVAEIEARTGNANEAVKTLRQALLLPAGMVVSIERLKVDPVWDPIRNDPGFQQLLAGKEQIGPNK